MEVHSTTTIHRSVNKSLRITSVRRHGGGGFAGHNIEKEVNITLRQSFLLGYIYHSPHILLNHIFASQVRKRDRAYTRASVVMVFVFIVAHTPRFVANILEQAYGVMDFPWVRI